MSNILPLFVLLRKVIIENCSTPPAPLAINHDQAPNALKADIKITVPTRNTRRPTMLNLTKRMIHFFAVFVKLFLAVFSMFVTFRDLLVTYP